VRGEGGGVTSVAVVSKGYGKGVRMRFAVKTRPEHQSWAELRDLWVAADEYPGFESMWNWDHFYPLPPLNTMAPFAIGRAN
jgi:hypothetical protein